MNALIVCRTPRWWRWFSDDSTSWASRRRNLLRFPKKADSDLTPLGIEPKFLELPSVFSIIRWCRVAKRTLRISKVLSFTTLMSTGFEPVLLELFEQFSGWHCAWSTERRLPRKLAFYGTRVNVNGNRTRIARIILSNSPDDIVKVASTAPWYGTSNFDSVSRIRTCVLRVIVRMSNH